MTFSIEEIIAQSPLNGFDVLARKLFKGCKSLEDVMARFNTIFPMPSNYMMDTPLLRLDTNFILEKNRITCSGATLLVYYALVNLSLYPKDKLFIITTRLKPTLSHSILCVINTEYESSTISPEEIYRGILEFAFSDDKTSCQIAFYDLLKYGGFRQTTTQYLPSKEDFTRVQMDGTTIAQIYREPEAFIDAMSRFYQTIDLE